MTASRENSDIKPLFVLFVCTGNTCRSPMAEAIFGHKCKELGISAYSASAGLFASGSGISDGAKFALSSLGITDFRHTPQNVTEKLIADSDVVYGISKNHASSLRALFPQYSEKIRALPFDIADPYGCSDEIYCLCAGMIEKAIDAIIPDIERMENEG